LIRKGRTLNRLIKIPVFHLQNREKIVNCEYLKIWKEIVVVSFIYCNGIDIQILTKAAETSIKVIGNPARIRAGYLKNINQRNQQIPDPPKLLSIVHRGPFLGGKAAGP
jgi:hypothetical protein